MFSRSKLRQVVSPLKAPLAAAVSVLVLLTAIRVASAQEGVDDTTEGTPPPSTYEGEGKSPEGADFPLVVGTSSNPTGTNNDIYEIDVLNDNPQLLTADFPVGGATYDANNDRLLFTSSAESGNIDQLWELPIGGTLNNLGTIMDVGGGAQRIDGLAISGGVLYGSYAAGTAEDGIWEIDMTTLEATLVYPFTDSISGIDADPSTGKIYGVNDTTLSLVLIDVAGNSMLPVAAYPVGEIDIDGLAISSNGRAYLITDQPGSLYVYNLNTEAYETPLTAPWASSDTFSGGAYIFETTNWLPVIFRGGN